MTEAAPMNEFLMRLEKRIADRKNSDPGDSYVASLFARGRPKIAQKLGEEATETVIAAMRDDRGEMTSEAADLLFHLMILLSDAGIGLGDVIAELERREGVSGHAEKAARKKEI